MVSCNSLKTLIRPSSIIERALMGSVGICVQWLHGAWYCHCQDREVAQEDRSLQASVTDSPFW